MPLFYNQKEIDILKREVRVNEILLAAKDTRLEIAEAQISRLKEEVQKLKSDNSAKLPVKTVMEIIVREAESKDEKLISDCRKQFNAYRDGMLESLSDCRSLMARMTDEQKEYATERVIGEIERVAMSVGDPVHLIHASETARERLATTIINELREESLKVMA